MSTRSANRILSSFLVAIMLLTMFDMSFASAAEGSLESTGYTAAANGEANKTTSNSITLNFDEAVSGLLASDIMITDGTASATINALNAVSATQYTLVISGVTKEGTINLKINKEGVDSAVKIVVVHKSPITVTVANIGGAAFVRDSTGIKLTFNGAVPDLSVDDIILSAGTPSSVSNYAASMASKGALRKTSDTVYELELIDINKTGTLGVEIAKAGVEATKKNVVVNAKVDKTALQSTPPRSYFPQNITDLPNSPGLNDLFKFLNPDGGTDGRVESEADWLDRKEELRDLIQYYYYGRKYPTPKSAITVNTQTNQVNVTIKDNDRTVTASLGNVTVPAGVAPEGGWPVIFAFGFGQTSMATANGYAVISVSNWGGSRTGNYYNLYPFDPYQYDFNTGSIMTAAWTVSRIIDAMEISAEANDGENQWNINPYKSITTGVSINGKYALMSAAMDDRVGGAAPVDSGQSGVSSFRYITEGKLFYYNSPLDRIYRRNQKGLNSIQYSGESFWMGLGTAAGFHQQTDMNYLPFDSHAVESLLAPRPLIAFVADNNFDWTTPPSSITAMSAAKEVYEFLDSDNIAVRVRDGAHAIQDRDVPFMIAVMDKEFSNKSLEVRDLYPSSNPPSYGLGNYNKISDMTIYPYDIDSSYIRWSRPGKYTLWTENEIVTEGIATTIKVHSDDTKVKLTILDADNKPTADTWTADVVSGIAEFKLTAEQVKIGRYEITTVGNIKDDKTVYLQGIDLATALRHGTARNDNGSAVMYGFTSKINKNLVEVYANESKLTQSFQEDTEQAWILNYGVTTNPNENNSIPNNAFNVITLKKLQMEAMPGSTFEISIDKSKLANNQETVSWKASQAVQKLGPQPYWPQAPNSSTDDGTRPLIPATTTNFKADVAFSLNDEVELAAGDKLEVTFSEPMYKNDFGIGFDFSDDFTLQWAEDNESVQVTFNDITKTEDEVGNIYIMRLSDAAGNLIAAPIHHSFSLITSSSDPIPPSGQTYDKYRPLKDVYKNYFTLGIFGAGENNALIHNFAAYSPGNEMKPESTQRVKGTFTFGSADSAFNNLLSRNPNMQFYGHTLAWHSQTPTWMWDAPSFNRDVALENLNTHIEAVLEHFGGRLEGMDVVNEAIGTANPSDWKASLAKGEGWYMALGWEWVERAFLKAAEVVDSHPDWDVKLIYNDFGLDSPNKARVVYEMVKDINERYKDIRPNGKPLIEVIGMQGHYNLTTSAQNVENSIKLFATLPGVHISVTEMDIGTPPVGTLTPENENNQAMKYAELFEIYKRYAVGPANKTDNPKVIERISISGVRDATSGWRAGEFALLFDSNGLAKEALIAVLNPEAYLASHEYIEPEPEQEQTPVDGVHVYDAAKGDAWSGANIILGNDAAQWPWSTAGSDNKVAFVPEKDATYRLSFNYTAAGTSSIRVRWIKDAENGNYTDGDGAIVNSNPYSANQIATKIPAYFNSGMVNGGSYTLTTEIKLNGNEAANGLIGNIGIRGGEGGNAYSINWIKVEKVGANGAPDELLVSWPNTSQEETKHNITAAAESGGTISPSGIVKVVAGESQTFAIVANNNFEIADVIVDGASVGAVSSYTFDDVTGDHSITATFKAMEIDPVTPIKSSLTGPVSALVGQSVNLSVKVDSGVYNLNTISFVMNYDPSRLEFATNLDEDGLLLLDEKAILSTHSDIQVLGAGVKEDEGKIFIILSTSGKLITVNDDVVTLQGKVKADATTGNTTVSVSDINVLENGVSQPANTTADPINIMITKADVSALNAKIHQAEQLIATSVEGSSPGQYPTGSKGVLQTAVNAAVLVRDKASSTEAEIETAILALDAQINLFLSKVNKSTPSANKTALNTAITEAQAKLDQAKEGTKIGQYPAAAIADLQLAIQSANATKNSSSASQGTVDAAVDSLNAAVNLFSSKIITLIPGATSVTIKDLSLLAKYFGTTSSDLNWNEVKAADLFDKGEITIRELAAVARMIIDDWLKQ